jgi:uncharacterized coiled-coil DUF342 family protein
LLKLVFQIYPRFFSTDEEAMSAAQPVRQTSTPFPNSFFSKCPLPALGKCKSYICENPLMQRVTSNWKVILMDCSTIIAISSFALTFFMGSTLICAAFFATSLACGVGSFYMRRFAMLTDLEVTAKGLKESKEKIEVVVKTMEKENARLSASNQELERNNTLFQQNNQTLNQQVTQFTSQVTQLNQQVTQLTLQVTQLRESAERIRSEIVSFQQQNSHLNNNVNHFTASLLVLDQQINGSRALCDQISTHLASQQEGLGQQLAQLASYLNELRAENRMVERIQELGALNMQIQQAAAQLHQTQVQYATERTQFQTIREALVQLKDQFDQAIREAAEGMRANNQEFSQNVNALSNQRQRIQELLNSHLAGAASH